jgi:hypothetical protein
MGAIKSGITQATASTEGVISAEGKIGKNKASGSIDSEGIWDLGIDFKVGGLGITNDYGGAITISIAGQSITWGREGGKIHYDLGGFEVIVEARDCVVTETKLIMGIEVASHTYPDPGCEPPEPPSVPSIPAPNNPGVSKEIPDTDELIYVVIGESLSQGYTSNSDRVIYYLSANTSSSSKVSDIPDLVPAPATGKSIPFLATSNFKARKDESYTYPLSPQSDLIIVVDIETEQDTSKNTLGRAFYRPAEGGTSEIFWATTISSNIRLIRREVTRNGVPSNDDSVEGVRQEVWAGKASTLKKQFGTLWKGNDITTRNPQVQHIIKVGKQPTFIPKPFLQPGVPPNMNKDCCNEIIDALDDLKEVLHVDFFKKQKFSVPSYLLAPGCTPDKKVEAKNYYNLFQMLFQAIAHGTIISPKIDIQDADSVKEGDQTINSEYLSATGWAEAVTKMLYEIVDDGNVGTNMDIRTGVTVTQLLVALADLSHKVDCIIDCIGVTTIRTKGEVETSYNLVGGEPKTKGFDPKKANQKLDLNSDISTEQLLSSLLRTRKNPIVKEEIHPKSPTLFEMLQDLKQKA